MSEKIMITTDSALDRGTEITERFNIQVLPLSVNLNDRIYTDGIDIVPDDIYKNYDETGTLPKTAAPNLGQTIEFFRKYTEEGFSIVHFTISQRMSSSYQNAVLASKEFEHVYVVDSKNLSSGGGLLIAKAGELRDEGKSAEEIAQICTDLADYVDASFIIGSLEYLVKGGRCSAAAAFGANMLNIKPSIIVRDGEMKVSKKYRGKFEKSTLKYMKDQLGDGSDIDLDRVFITHAGVDDALVQECVELVRSIAPFKEVIFNRAGCTISSHCGKDCIGVLFIRKTKLSE